MTERNNENSVEEYELDPEEHLAIAETLSLAYLFESEEGWVLNEDYRTEPDMIRAAAEMGTLHLNMAMAKLAINEERAMQELTRPTVDVLGVGDDLREAMKRAERGGPR